MAKVTLEKMFVFNGHTMDIEIDDYSEFQNPFATSQDNFPMKIVSVSSVPIFEEDGTPRGTYPKNYAEEDATEFLNESYDQRSELDTLSVFIHETKEAVYRNFANGTFTRVGA